MSRRGTIFSILAVLAGILFFKSVYIVTEVQQALVLEFGRKVAIRQDPGIYAKLFWQDVVYVEKRIIALDAKAEEYLASDQKRIVVDTFARFIISDPFLFYQAVRSVGEARRKLQDSMETKARQVIANAPMAALLSDERAKLMTEIRDIVNIEARAFGLNVVDVRIKRADLPETNLKNVFDRMKAEREKEAREFRAQGGESKLKIMSSADREKAILLAEATRDGEILRGEGDGEAVRIFAEAFGRDTEFFEFYRSMQAYEKALNQNDTTMVLSPDSEFFKFFDRIGKTPR